jgi:hypothetical protein
MAEVLQSRVPTELREAISEELRGVDLSFLDNEFDTYIVFAEAELIDKSTISSRGQNFCVPKLLEGFIWFKNEVLADAAERYEHPKIDFSGWVSRCNGLPTRENRDIHDDPNDRYISVFDSGIGRNTSTIAFRGSKRATKALERLDITEVVKRNADGTPTLKDRRSRLELIKASSGGILHFAAGEFHASDETFENENRLVFIADPKTL